MTRRDFVSAAGIAAASVCIADWQAFSSEARPRKMTRDLTCGSIGVSAGQKEAVELAARHGFESVGADGAFLAGLGEDQLNELKALMREKRVVFGAAGLPLEFRQDETAFATGMKGLPKVAAGLERAGVKRVGTWLSPAHKSLPYVQNFRQHSVRLREVAKVLKDHNLRLGLEYVGPKTAWANGRYPFIHTLGEMRELLLEIGTGNAGFVLDSWHWYNAGDSVADLLGLKPEEVIAVDLNDAPAGIPKDRQVDSRRELPCATGVIDVGAFLNALNDIGYDGPVRVEPFNQTVNGMTKEDACAAAAASLKKAFGLLKA